MTEMIPVSGSHVHYSYIKYEDIYIPTHTYRYQGVYDTSLLRVKISGTTIILKQRLVEYRVNNTESLKESGEETFNLLMEEAGSQNSRG